MAVSEKPVSEKPVSEKPVSEKPVSEKPVSEKPVSEKTIKRLAHMDVTEATLFAVRAAQSATEPMKVLDELWERSHGAFDYSFAWSMLEDWKDE